jgi:predicted DNA-binding antitoxin AbrB/MazE fold protein
MSIRVKAIYESGMIRPVAPLELAEGTRLDIIVVTYEKPQPNVNVTELLAEIAALPLEGASDSFRGREHDSILYPKKPAI